MEKPCLVPTWWQLGGARWPQPALPKGDTGQELTFQDQKTLEGKKISFQEVFLSRTQDTDNQWRVISSTASCFVPRCKLIVSHGDRTHNLPTGNTPLSGAVSVRT